MSMLQFPVVRNSEILNLKWLLHHLLIIHDLLRISSSEARTQNKLAIYVAQQHDTKADKCFLLHKFYFTISCFVMQLCN